jgi:hypothetical protein
MIMSDNNNGSGYAGRDVATQMKISKWFEQHKNSLLSYPTRQDVCDALLADTGLKISTYTCGKYEKALGVARRASRAALKAGTVGRSKSAEILARALHTTMETLIKVIDDERVFEGWFTNDIDELANHLEAVKAVAQRRRVSGLVSLDAHATPPTT